MVGIRRALSFASRRGYRSKPLPRCSERSAILKGSGFSCGSLAGEACVSELAEDEGEKITTVSASAEDVVRGASGQAAAREAKHVFLRSR